MAGFVDKIKNMWASPDDEYEYDDYEFEGEEETYNYDNFDSGREREYRRSERSERKSTSSFSDYETGNKVVNISASTSIQVVLFKPERFGEDTRTIADEILKNRTVVLNLEDTNRDMSRRIIDFLSGVAYAKQGKIKKIANSTFIIMPENVDFTGDDLLDELENSGVYF